MKLSYIVPVYNVEKYIRQCLDSILSQTMDDYEIILIDDGSPDNCPAICDEYQEKYPDIIKVVHKKNGGLAAARNTGMDIACGDFIFFVDSDDFFIGDKVAALLSKAYEYDADMLQTSYKWCDETEKQKGHVSTSFDTDTLYTHNELEKELCYSNRKSRVIFVWRNLYKRSFLERNNIRFEEGLKMIEDAPFDTLALAKAERFVAVDIPVYCYRHRSGSLQRRKYMEDYDLYLAENTKLKIKYYTENCIPKKEFFEDLAWHIIVNLFPGIIQNIYVNKIRERYKILKRIGNSEMMRQSFRDYDINEFKSKSLDWWMVWCMKYKLYPIAHFICDKILYK